MKALDSVSSLILRNSLISAAKVAMVLLLAPVVVLVIDLVPHARRFDTIGDNIVGGISPYIPYFSSLPVATVGG